jgi:hypothetical protein
MHELGEWLIFAGRLFMLVVGFLAAIAATGVVVDWLIGRIGRHVKAYSLLIEFALHYKQFNQYRESLRDKRKEVLQHDFMRDIRRDSGTSD